MYLEVQDYYCCNKCGMPSIQNYQCSAINFGMTYIEVILQNLFFSQDIA